MIKYLLLFLLLLNTLFAESQIQDQNSYVLGEGIKVGELPIYLGGYISVDYRNKNDENRYRLDDIALLSYGNYDNFSYMAELEYQGLYVVREKNNKYTNQRATTLHAERLHVDYEHNENYLFRVGKYNSPVGYWNLLPINVLRDTTSNPVSTNILFPKSTTGAMATYSSYEYGDLKVNLMMQHNNDLDSTYNNYNIDEHYGLGVEYAQDEWEIKANIGEFEGLFNNEASEKLYYYMVSLKYETEQFKITSELGSQKVDKYYTTRYAGYVQGIYSFNEKHAGVVRLESYDDIHNAIKEDIAVLGYSYRPLYPVSIKTEYQLHSLRKNNQFLLSLSVMF